MSFHIAYRLITSVVAILSEYKYIAIIMSIIKVKRG